MSESRDSIGCLPIVGAIIALSLLGSIAGHLSGVDNSLREIASGSSLALCIKAVEVGVDTAKLPAACPKKAQP